MMLHGCTLDAEDMAEISGMDEVAAANQFLVVYPEQSRMANLLKCWNWFIPNIRHATRGNSILAAVVDNIQSTYNVDPERVYVVGVSAGTLRPSSFGAHRRQSGDVMEIGAWQAICAATIPVKTEQCLAGKSLWP